MCLSDEEWVVEANRLIPLLQENIRSGIHVGPSTRTIAALEKKLKEVK